MQKKENPNLDKPEKTNNKKTQNSNFRLPDPIIVFQ